MDVYMLHQDIGFVLCKRPYFFIVGYSTKGRVTILFVLNDHKWLLEV